MGQAAGIASVFPLSLDLARQQGINTVCETTLCGTKLGRVKAEGHSNTPTGMQELHGSGAQLLCQGCWAFKLLQLGIGKIKDEGKEMMAFGDQWTEAPHEEAWS